MLRKSRLVRKTELRNRSYPKPWRRKPEDKVKPEDAAYIVGRDRVCVLSTIDSTHVCRNTFGDEIAPDGDYEIDHVDNGGTGKRGPSSRDNLVRLCPWGHKTKTDNARLIRPALRDYLRRVQPESVA